MIRLGVLNDTIMITLSQNQQNILLIFLEKGSSSSSTVHAELANRDKELSLVTVKRELSEMKSAGLLEGSGAGRSVEYTISTPGRLTVNIDAKNYCATEPDKRLGSNNYNFSLFEAIPEHVWTGKEEKILNDATEAYHSNASGISAAIENKELERFVIELSWKSSRIEGNTYTLLDTEKLLNKGIEAPGHDKNEATMILNHKEAFKFVLENAAAFKEMSIPAVEEIHKILVKDLNVNLGLRSKPVGITGSKYRPLDNIHQIREALETLASSVKRVGSPHGKAMIALLGISYIQPFEDGNKRTSRLLANAILLAHACAPLSYRSVDEDSYREAVLVFYEINSLLPFKKIFIEQYDFAARNYTVKPS